jgi:WD40 repeat protein
MGKISVVDSYLNDTGESTPDGYGKNVKFYPSGDDLFTASDPHNGLSVWDRKNMKVVYTYKRDEIRGHTYSEMGIIGANTYTGIKLYDLRCRHHIVFITISGCRICSWDGDYLHCAKDDRIYKYNYRNTQEYDVITAGGEVKALQSFGQFNMCIYEEKGENWLSLMKDNVYNKRCYGDKLVRISNEDDQFTVYVPYKNILKLFCNNKDWEIEIVGVGAIRDIIYDEETNTMYLITKSKVYTIEQDWSPSSTI